MVPSVHVQASSKRFHGASASCVFPVCDKQGPCRSRRSKSAKSQSRVVVPNRGLLFGRALLLFGSDLNRTSDRLVFKSLQGN